MFQWVVLLMRFSFLFFFVLSPSKLEIQECKVATDLSEGDRCWAWIEDIRPSQFALGQWEVDETIKSLKAFSPADIHRLKTARPIPINIAPNGDIFMYNRHHTVRAILNSPQIPDSDKWVYAIISNNWSSLGSMNEFFRQLIVTEQIRLLDAKGVGPIDPFLLPKHVGQLQNDPFRSLASVTKQYGCWKGGKSVPFIEFLWADYFRSALQEKFLLFQVTHVDTKRWCEVRPYSSICVFKETDILEAVLEDALRLCNTPEASNIPGYIERDTPLELPNKHENK